MGTKLSKQTKRELLEALRERYRNAVNIDKTKILDEFIKIAGCHRKHAIRLLTGVDPVATKEPWLGRTIYSEAVRQALVVLWEAADRICAKRLKAILPGLIAAMERHGHLALDPDVRQLLLAVSPATIDRLLAPIRGTAGHRRKRKPTNKFSREIPVRTFADWKEPAPGFLEIDFVAHGGDSMQGTFLWSLVATDVCSGWTEAVALVAREQSLVVEGLEVIRRQLPVPVLGIDSDNDSAFINETLQGYCKERQIEFTRSRPYQKNDQAWIEQKIGSVIRRFVALALGWAPGGWKPAETGHRGVLTIEELVHAFERHLDRTVGPSWRQTDNMILGRLRNRASGRAAAGALGDLRGAHAGMAAAVFGDREFRRLKKQWADRGDPPATRRGKAGAVVEAFLVVTGRRPYARWNRSSDQLKGRQDYGLDVGYLADEWEKGSGYWRSGPRPA